MKLEECYIENFGKLHQMKCGLKGGMNSLTTENGWGKTTFSAFLKCMFYGMGSKKPGSRFDSSDYRKNYMPWQGGRFGGYVVFSNALGRFRITRFFGDRPSEDFFELRNEVTHEISKSYSEKIGEELFGIDSSGFEKSACIMQGAMEIGSNDSINTRLMGLLEGGGGDMNYEAAIGRLTAKRKEFIKTGGRGRIDKDKERIAELEDSLRTDDGMASEEWRTLNESLQRLEKDEKEKKAVKKSAERALKEFEESHENVKAEKGLIKSFICLFLMVLFSGLSAASFFMKLAPIQVTAVLCLISFICLIAFIVLIVLWFKNSKKSDKERDELEDALFESRSAYDESLKELETMQERMDSMKETIKKTKTGVQEQIAALRSRVKEDQARVDILDKALSCMRKARESLSGNYLDAMRNRFETYLKEVAPDNRKTSINTDFDILMEDHGLEHRLQEFSCGTQDVINICARFALVDALYKNEGPFVLMDDVFSNLDDKELSLAKEAAKKLSRRFQVIYLTCNSSRSIA